MTKQTTKPRQFLLDLLAFDSIYGKLTWYERARIHQIMNNNQDLNLSENCNTILYIITLNKWTPPSVKYPEWQKDVLHYETPEGEWEPVEHYRAANENLTKQINQIWEKH